MALSTSPTPALIQCQGILFDMDGILISSLGSVERSWTKWSKMRDIDPEYALSVIHGRRAIESVAELRPDLDPSAELALIEQIEIADGEGLTVLPGVLDLISSLPKDRWTVVTSATERLARSRLADARIPVPEHFISADSVTQGKPHPAPYLAGAKLLGFNSEACVVIEDSASGVKAGHAAGCIVVATTFSHPTESLEHADYLVTDLTGLTALAQNGGLELSLSPLPRS